MHDHATGRGFYPRLCSAFSMLPAPPSPGPGLSKSHLTPSQGKPLQAGTLPGRQTRPLFSPFPSLPCQEHP